MIRPILLYGLLFFGGIDFLSLTKPDRVEVLTIPPHAKMREQIRPADQSPQSILELPAGAYADTHP